MKFVSGNGVAKWVIPHPPTIPLPSLPPAYQRQSLPTSRTPSKSPTLKDRHASTPVVSKPVSPRFNPSKPPPIPLPPLPPPTEGDVTGLGITIPFPRSLSSSSRNSTLFSLSRNKSVSGPPSAVSKPTLQRSQSMSRTESQGSSFSIPSIRTEDNQSRQSLDFEDILNKSLPKRRKSVLKEKPKEKSEQQGSKAKGKGRTRTQTIIGEEEDSELDLEASFETSAYRAGVMKTSLEPDLLDRALKHPPQRADTSISAISSDSSSSDESFDLQFVTSKAPPSSIAKITRSRHSSALPSPSSTVFDVQAPPRSSSLLAPSTNRLLTRKSWTPLSTPPAAVEMDKKGKSDIGPREQNPRTRLPTKPPALRSPTTSKAKEDGNHKFGFKPRSLPVRN
ncbi:hypothetical protein BT69DRAFT_98878 [Atractiella rhizophila]|nr:hypothetical protein BT69DRAFT_98878 [Atractiella rhizophila]